MKCTDLLIQDHKVILRSLDVLQAMASCAEKEKPPAEEDVVTLLHFLRAFADDHHQMKEESALFPELRSHRPVTSFLSGSCCFSDVSG